MRKLPQFIGGNMKKSLTKGQSKNIILFGEAEYQSEFVNFKDVMEEMRQDSLKKTTILSE